MEEATGTLKQAARQYPSTALPFETLTRALQLEIAAPSLKQLMVETIGDLKQATQLIICGTLPSLTQTMELPLVREAQL
jgi:hypothetical protein